jgi:hypothetical protein
MRSFEISSLAILASSLLVKAVPVYVTDVEVVTEEITVTKEFDGSYHTGAPHRVGTYTRHGASVQASSVVAAPSSTAAPVTSVVVPLSSSSSSVAAAKSSSSVVVIPSPASSSSSVVVVAYSSSSSAAVKASDAAVLVQKPTSAAAATTAKPTTIAKPTTLATSTSAAKASSTAVAASSGGKRGLAYNSAAMVSPFSGSSKVSWAYNWASSSSGLSVSGIEYVPLLWGMASSFTGPWSAAASSAIKSGSKYLMSFNEPDLSTQANLSPGDAASGFKTHMMPFAGKAKLGAPAVTNGGSPMGLTWLKSFLSSCTNCQIDFVCIHWYDSASNVAYFKQYVQDAYTAGGKKPLWITEFQASGSEAEQNTFMKTVLPWLDSLDYVERYAWFMAGDASGQLLSSATSLSTLGNTFKSA